MLRNLLPFIAILPASAYSLITLACTRKFFNRTSPATLRPHVEAGVTILKPVKGMDAGSYENFASFCMQEYGGPVQLLFAAAAADDPVIPVIRHLIETHPDHDITLTINPAIHGPNYKVSNLINVFPRAKHDIIIVCDSDIRVPPDYLTSVISHFADPQIGLVTSPYRTSNVHNMATAVEATGFTTEMIPNVMVALQLEGLSFALGASMAVRRESLASIGGFETLSDYLADDYQLGNKIHRAGWHIALDGCFVESIMKTENLKTVLSRQLRWARTMRVSRPGGYLASGITLPFPAGMLAMFVAPSTLTGLSALCFLYAIRLGICTYTSRQLVRDRLLPRWLWLIPLRDMLAFFCWALSFLGNHVEWRGTRFRLKPGGKIKEIV
jgi:ceramide glucosyltransferase